MGKQVQQHPRCIFCGGQPATEEEFFPHWIRKIYPKSGPDKHTIQIMKNIAGSATGLKLKNGLKQAETVKGKDC